MGRANAANYCKADGWLRVIWTALFQARMTALRAWIAIMAASTALVPAPAHAFYGQSISTNATSEDGREVSGFLFYGGPGQPDPDTVPPTVRHLPDLRTLPPSDLHIKRLAGSRRALRLSNTVWNSGQGPLELTGEFNAATKQTRVYQHVYTGDGGQLVYMVGEFVWHPTHDHWHFDEFTLYELWTLTPDHRLGEVVASSDKLSYCVMDTDKVDQSHPGFPSRRSYGGCDQHQQGLSVGWGDTYKSTLDGQSLDLTGLPDGFYALISTVNPNAVILEEDYTNNSARVYLAVHQDRLTQVTLRQIRMAGCDDSLCE